MLMLFVRLAHTKRGVTGFGQTGDTRAACRTWDTRAPCPHSPADRYLQCSGDISLSNMQGASAGIPTPNSRSFELRHSTQSQSSPYYIVLPLFVYNTLVGWQWIGMRMVELQRGGAFRLRAFVPSHLSGHCKCHCKCHSHVLPWTCDTCHLSGHCKPLGRPFACPPMPQSLARLEPQPLPPAPTNHSCPEYPLSYICTPRTHAHTCVGDNSGLLVQQTSVRYISSGYSASGCMSCAVLAVGECDLEYRK
jgi:hypothetical protein